LIPEIEEMKVQRTVLIGAKTEKILENTLENVSYLF